jgi:hypothetical protein
MPEKFLLPERTFYGRLGWKSLHVKVVSLVD